MIQRAREETGKQDGKWYVPKKRVLKSKHKCCKGNVLGRKETSGIRQPQGSHES
jgi:hypothetical protein